MGRGGNPEVPETELGTMLGLGLAQLGTEPEMETEMETELETELDPGNRYSALHPSYESVVRRKTRQGVDHTFQFRACYLLHSRYKHQLTTVVFMSGHAVSFRGTIQPALMMWSNTNTARQARTLVRRPQ